ncbi:glycosyltransferase family 4 protein [Thermococcus sp.]|uniref:glycosyltransferase family 4 protein n=1 Tax=Thermococcus sp. TaxID=35749 RepID=UPI002602CBC4|nr:glycosyltransferase family 4 protein [Thermococcus sp.]
MKVTLMMPYSDTPSWGVQNVAYNLVQGFIKLCNEFERKDIKIRILSNVGTFPKPQRVLFSRCPQLEVIYYKQLQPITFFGDAQNMFLSKRLFYSILFSSDIIHSHDVVFSLPVAKMFKHSNVIHNFHGLPWNEKRYINSAYVRFSYNTMTARAQKLAKLNNTRFVAISHFVKREIQKTLEILDDNISIIPDPVSEEFFEIKKRTEEGLIFYPARLIPRKNHVPLIKALGILKKEGPSGFKLALTGTVEDKNYFERIRRTISKYNLNSNVMFIGKIPKEKLFEYYSKASVVVLTSKEESFSLAVAEAMATGTPVIASPVGIVPEAILNRKNGYIINPDDPKDIAEKLRLILEDNKKRKIMEKHARKTAERWKSENIVKRLIETWGR